MFEQTVLLQELKRALAESGEEQLQTFIEQTRRRHAIEQMRQLTDRPFGARVDRKIELRREPHRAQHAHRILPVARFRIADQLQAPRPHVAHPIHEVPDGEVVDVVVEAIGREIAPPHVLFDGSVDVVPQDAPGGVEGPMLRLERRRRRHVHHRGPLPIHLQILRILALRRRRRAKSRHFDDFLPEMHVRQAETPADQAAIAKYAAYLVRQRIGRHVEVFRPDSQQQIAHRPAHQKCLKTSFFQPIKHL